MNTKHYISKTGHNVIVIYMLTSLYTTMYFKNGTISLEPSTATFTNTTPKNIGKNRKLVQEDHRRTIHSWYSWHHQCVLRNSSRDPCLIWNQTYSYQNMHCIAGKFTPKILTPAQKVYNTKLCQDVHQQTGCRGSSEGMKLGSTVMSQRPNNSLHSGRE